MPVKKISALRAGLLFLNPAPARGGLGAFSGPLNFPLRHFRFAHGLAKKIVSYIETYHVSGRFFSGTFSHSVSGNHKSGLPRLADWLAGRGRPNDKLAGGRLAGWLAAWPAGRLAGCMAGCLAGRRN